MQAHKAYRKYFTNKSLTDLFISKVGVNPTVGLDKVTKDCFESKLDENIALILRKVDNLSYRFTNYRQVLFGKGLNKKPREICIPTIRDKLTLAALSKVIDEAYGRECNAPQPQTVIGDIINQINEDSYDSFIKLDIEGFYDSIPHNQLVQCLSKKVRKSQLVHLVEELLRAPSSSFDKHVSTRRGEGIPQGLSVSNKLANIYVADIDDVFRSEADCFYRRYVDDIFILCNYGDIERLKGLAEDLLDEKGLSTSPEKYDGGLLREKQFTYLGYSFSPNGIVSVGSSSRHRLEMGLDRVMRSYHRTSNHEGWLWRLNFRITGCRISEDGISFERFGWLYYYSRINDIRLLADLDRLVDRLLVRYGIPPQEGIKSFKKTYYQMNYHYKDTKYIWTFDDSMSVSEKRHLLELLYDGLDLEGLSDDEVSSLFNRRIRQEARKLERDVGLIS